MAPWHSFWNHVQPSWRVQIQLLALLMGSESSLDTRLLSKSQWEQLMDSPVIFCENGPELTWQRLWGALASKLWDDVWTVAIRHQAIWRQTGLKIWLGSKAVLCWLFLTHVGSLQTADHIKGIKCMKWEVEPRQNLTEYWNTGLAETSQKAQNILFNFPNSLLCYILK